VLFAAIALFSPEISVYLLNITGRQI
jgi:hypothetical protein